MISSLVFADVGFTSAPLITTFSVSLVSPLASDLSSGGVTLFLKQLKA